MRIKTTHEVNLFGVFAEERMKYGDEFTISYSNKNQQLKYSMEGNGSLTVKFGRDGLGSNREDFYYSPEGKPNEQILVYQMAGNGEHKRFEDEFLHVPSELRAVTRSYAEKEERKRMGIERAQSAARKHRKLTFGNER